MKTGDGTVEKSYLHNPGALKIDLMLRGARIEDPVLKAWACGAAGIDIMLPEKTLANIPCSEEFIRSSPYSIRKKGEGHVLSDGSAEVPVEFVPRPAFYDRKTSTGVRLSEIASVHGSYTVITPSRRCDFFNRNIECRYCAGDFDLEGENPRVFSVDEVTEAVEAVLEERSTEIIYLSIGFSQGPDGGIEFLAPYIEAVKRRFNCLVAVETLPPTENRWIDETYALGADSVLYNLEIYDPELFELICPGRAELVGRKRYLDALRHAAKVFPNGTVASHLIVGLEPPGSTCLGIDKLTEAGVVPILPIYRPRRGRSLAIDPLNTEIIIPVYKHLYRAVKKRGINLNWVRDLSMVTTPVEIRSLVDGPGQGSFLESFYKSSLGHKTAVGLSTLRRKLRVKRGSAGSGEDEKDPAAGGS